MLIEHIFLPGKIRSPVRPTGLAAAAFLFLGLTVAANAQVSDLRAFEGAWTGTGTLSHRNGVTERIRCRVDYVPRGEGSVEQTMRCQSDTSGFNIVSQVSDEAGRLSGDWSETSTGARGTLRGTIVGGSIRATVLGQGFSAGIGIAARGNRQSVQIRAAGTDITGVTMALIRSGR